MHAFIPHENTCAHCVEPQPASLDVTARKQAVYVAWSVPAKSRYCIRPDGSVELTTVPEVNSDWENRKFEISCDAEKLPEILNSIVAKSGKKGESFSLDDICVSKSKQLRIEKPKLSTQA